MPRSRWYGWPLIIDVMSCCDRGDASKFISRSLRGPAHCLIRARGSTPTQHAQRAAPDRQPQQTNRALCICSRDVSGATPDPACKATRRAAARSPADSAATLARAARHPCKYECGVAFRLMVSSILGHMQQDENDNFGGLMAGPGAA